MPKYIEIAGRLRSCVSCPLGQRTPGMAGAEL